MKSKIAKIIKPSIFKKKSDLPMSLRTRLGEMSYLAAKKAGLTKPLTQEDRIKEWKFWALIDNVFPYDIAFKTHHMLIPKRVTTEKNLTDAERKELDEIMQELSSVYDSHMTNFVNMQSIPEHHHIHLFIYKDSRSDFKL